MKPSHLLAYIVIAVISGFILVENIDKGEFGSLGACGALNLFVVSAVQAVILIVISRFNDKSEEFDSKASRLRSFAVIGSILCAIIIWVAVGQPDFTATCNAMLNAVVVCVVVAVYEFKDKLFLNTTYASPKLPLGICAITFCIGIFLFIFVQQVIGFNFDVVYWYVPTFVTSILVALIVARERYMAAKSKRLESGRALPIGINAPKRPLGESIILVLCAIPVFFASVSLAFLPWTLRAFNEAPEVVEWVQQRLDGNWKLVEINNPDLGYSHYRECYVSYIFERDDGKMRAVSVRFPGFDKGERYYSKGKTLLDSYIEVTETELRYILGVEDPVIEGFARMKEQFVPPKVLWTQIDSNDQSSIGLQL